MSIKFSNLQEMELQIFGELPDKGQSRDTSQPSFFVSLSYPWSICYLYLILEHEFWTPKT